MASEVATAAERGDMDSEHALTKIPTADAFTRETRGSRPKKSRDRKRKHSEAEIEGTIEVLKNTDQPPDFNNTKNSIAEDTERPSKKSRRSKRSKTTWKVSEPVGGLLADLLPIFSSDEEHLLLGYSHSVKVYSTSTSMLVRACQTGGIPVSSFCLSSQSPAKFYILLQDGKIQWWDWTTGQKLKTWELGAQVSDIAVSSLSTTPDAADVLFIAESRKGYSEITAHRLLGNEETAAKSLFRDQQTIRTIKTIENGRFIVAITSKAVIVGTRASTSSTKLKQLHYSFKTFDAPDTITCSDVRVHPRAVSKEPSDSSIDIALGLEDGSIRVYYDAGTITDPKIKQQRTTPKNEKLHWHRQAVSSVNWASNGNYLLSGGSETVLVLWQLDTKAKTTLPHLTSTVEAITVSPKGSSYAIRLADNSVMILGATDFVPTFNAAGIGFPSTGPHEEASLEFLLPHRRTPITCSPMQPPRLVTAVPSDLPRNRVQEVRQPGIYTNTSLQSIPLSSLTTSVSRQALVDGHATSIRQRPNGKLMATSNVVLLAVSHGGDWLATIDEWFQPLDDIISNSTDELEAKAKQLATVETNLVFWRWNEPTGSWDRSTRVTDPYTNEHGGLHSGGLALDLVSDPERNAFWTLSSDGQMKYWTVHRRNNTVSRLTSNTAIGLDYVWKCTKSINVPGTSLSKERDTLAIPSARLTISKDGSVFAITTMISASSQLTVFTIQQDTSTKHVFTLNLEHSGISTALLNQYLIIADCESVVVRDLTDSRKWYKASFGSNAVASDLAIPPLIAVDQEHQAFAISVPRKSKSDGSVRSQRSRIMVFSPLSSTPVATLDNRPLSAALLCVPAQQRFYALTTEAEIYSIFPHLVENMNNLEMPQSKTDVDEDYEPTRTSNMLSNIFGEKGATEVQSRGEEDVVMIDTVTQQKKVAWEDIPGLNLDQPFTLPKTSAIQMMSAVAMKA